MPINALFGSSFPEIYLSIYIYIYIDNDSFSFLAIYMASK